MFQVWRNIKLYSQPDRESARTGPLITGAFSIEKVADAPGSPGWWSVVARRGAIESRGFLPQDMVVIRPELSPPDDPAVDIVAFMTQLTIAARVHGVNRDLLAAIAVAETGIANIPTAASGSAFGPFQFTKGTWSGLVREFGTELGIDENDRFKPSRQAIFAALCTRIATEKLEEVLVVEGAEKTRLPTATELYFAHFLGWPAARKLLVLDRAAPVRQALVDAGQDADEVIAQNKSLLGDGSISIAEVLDRLGERLQTAIGKVAELTATLPEFLRFTPTSTGEPPWLAKARTFLDLAEEPGDAASNPQIEEFHASTVMGRATDDVPWCASFVNFCMANCGNEKVAQSRLNSARAADWLKWGQVSLTEPTLGALVVLHPQSPKASGHVGFFVRANDSTVTLFGGNQGNAVNERDYAKTAVRDVRWMEWA